MKNCIKDVDAVEVVLHNIKEIIDVVGRTNIVFPPYKVDESGLKKARLDFSAGLAIKVLAQYDKMSYKNKLTVQLYELAVTVSELAEEILQEIKKSHFVNKKNFLAAACIL